MILCLESLHEYVLSASPWCVSGLFTCGGGVLQGFFYASSVLGQKRLTIPTLVFVPVALREGGREAGEASITRPCEVFRYCFLLYVLLCLCVAWRGGR